MSRSLHTPPPTTPPYRHCPLVADDDVIGPSWVLAERACPVPLARHPGGFCPNVSPGEVWVRARVDGRVEGDHRRTSRSGRRWGGSAALTEAERAQHRTERRRVVAVLGELSRVAMPVDELVDLALGDEFQVDARRRRRCDWDVS